MGGTFTGSVTFTQAIIGNLTGNVTGNVTGTVSDVSNHLSTLANGTAGKFVGADELKTKSSHYGIIIGYGLSLMPSFSLGFTLCD